MSEFNYKDFLKNSSFLNEVEETEEKFSVDKLEDKVKLDVSFIDNYSLLVYFKILLHTPIVLIIRLLKNKSSIIK